MASTSGDGPAVDDAGVRFVLHDRYRRLAAVRLVQELGLPGDLFFGRERTRHSDEWSLHLPLPPVARMEYLFEVEDDNGNRATITDPGNAERAAGAFGDKSVVRLPGYEPPAWLDQPGVDAVEVPFEVEATCLGSAITGTVWAPRDLPDGHVAPLLVVHDGPEFASLGGFTRYLAAAVGSGELPPVRAALLDPGDRNAWYSANRDYAATLTTDVRAALPPATVVIGAGASLGALAMLHAHRSAPMFDGLFLQSGSFFTPELDGQESAFSGYGAVTAFVESVHAAETDDRPVPTAITCGVVEENLANNKRMEGTLARLGYPVRLTVEPDAHNFTAWRDALHPHLTRLVTKVVSTHAA